eukprot:363762-Chlamydomonas_euryale.AAC.7
MLAGQNTDAGGAQEACEPVSAALRAVLGDAATSGCRCVTPPLAAPTFARANATALGIVLGRAAQPLLWARGVDYRLQLGNVGAVPMYCQADDFSLWPDFDGDLTGRGLGPDGGGSSGGRPPDFGGPHGRGNFQGGDSVGGDDGGGGGGGNDGGSGGGSSSGGVAAELPGTPGAAQEPTTRRRGLHPESSGGDAAADSVPAGNAGNAGNIGPGFDERLDLYPVWVKAADMAQVEAAVDVEFPGSTAASAQGYGGNGVGGAGSGASNAEGSSAAFGSRGWTGGRRVLQALGPSPPSPPASDPPPSSLLIDLLRQQPLRPRPAPPPGPAPIPEPPAVSMATPIEWRRLRAGEPVPAGFRVAACKEAAAASQQVLALVAYLDVCGVDGGTVRGPTSQFGAALPTAAVRCPDPSTPSLPRCYIVTSAPGDAEPGPPPPPASPPPPPELPVVVARAADGTALAPDSLVTCDQFRARRQQLLPLLLPTDVCRLRDGTVDGATGRATCAAHDSPLPDSSGVGGAASTNCALVMTAKPPQPPPPPYNEPPSPPPEAPIVRVPGLSLVKAWRLGRGFVIYIGAGLVPDDQVFGEEPDDRVVYHQMLRSIAHIERYNGDDISTVPQI